jgi:hypothetical protein
MWYTILITLVVDFGGLLFVYLLLRDRVRRATSVESRMAEVREEVSRLLVELNQATDRNIALMEDKITALNAAISTADKKIGLLRRETEKHDVGSQIYSRLAEGRHHRAAAAVPAAAESAEYRTAEANPPSTSAGGFGDAESAGYRDAESTGFGGEQGMQDAESAGYRDAESAGVRDLRPARSSRPPLEAPRAVVARPAEPTTPLAVELSGAAATDVRQRVMMLYRAGFSPSLIASRVGAPVGEVELIISLEQRKGQA